MSLTSGTRLGSYEIASAIGAGGMGEVYRARDTKLRRDVAIKIATPPLGGFGQREFSISPEGNRIAYVAADKLYVWQPDGRTLAYTCPTDKGTAICAKAADGSGDSRGLVERAATPVFSPDGRYMVFLTSEPADAGIMLWKLDEPAPRPYIPAMNVSYPVGFSADGRYFAYTSCERSEPRIYIRRFPAGDTQWEVPSFGVPRTLFTTTTEVLGAGLVITPDGTRILTVQHQVTDAPRTGIVVVQNWWAEFSGKQSTQ